MTHRKRPILIVVVAALAVAAGAGTVAGQSAPDCSQVSYSGDGSVENPYEVGNVDQLQCINSQGLSVNYTQASNIDASGTSAWNSGEGFEPIGNESTVFTGTFNGSGYTVTGLYIDRSRSADDGSGLFGRAGPGALLENIRVEDVYVNNSDGNVGGLVGRNRKATVESSYVTGSVSSSGNSVGGLVGENRLGTVTSSYATGDVSGDGEVGGLAGDNGGGTVQSSYATSNVSGSSQVGGLVGVNTQGDVVESNATGDVSGSGNGVGGLVGENDFGTVRESYAIGNASGEFAVGGLVGSNNAEIRMSYATGNVSSTGRAGGLVGFNNAGRINRSYATGSVLGSDNLGGLIGRNANSGPVNGGYWDTDTTGQAASPGSPDANGLSTEEMVGSGATDNLTPFDFTDTWDVESGESESYPFLRNNTQTPPPEPSGDGGDDDGDGGDVGPTNPAPDCSAVSYNGDGTESDPYEVGNVNELQCIKEKFTPPNPSYELVSDIDASETQGWNNDSGFEPIGKLKSQPGPGPFNGTIDGNGYTVTGLTIYRPSENYVGVFGVVRDDAKISNISLRNANITGRSNVGMVGLTKDASVTNSSVTGNITGKNSVGGVVGSLGSESGDSTVSDSYASVNVTGEEKPSTLDSPPSDAGGLVGDMFQQAKVVDSHSTGTIDGFEDVGGLVGGSAKGNITESYSTADVNGTEDVGGLVGESGNITESYAAGTATGTRNVGGLVGTNSGYIDESYSETDVEGGTDVGGLIGKNFGRSDSPTVRTEITETYATGEVSSETSVGSAGGLIGDASSETTANSSYWDTQSTGQDSSENGIFGSTVGLVTSEMTGAAAESNMKEFDFTGTWETVQGDYPILSWQTEEDSTPETVSVVINNVGASAWEIQSQQENVGQSGVNNPEISLEVGTRYEFENNGWSAHPFEIRDSNGDALLSQSDTGTFEDDPGVNWQDNGETFAFTVTQSLADEMNKYVCTIHTGAMQGSISASSGDGGGGGNITTPLPGFANPPRNIPTSEGGLDDNLVEDLDGDGEVTDIEPTVSVFGQLIRGEDLGLTPEQASRLDWDEDNGDSVDIDDMVALFGRQIRAG